MSAGHQGQQECTGYKQCQQNPIIQFFIFSLEGEGNK